MRGFVALALVALGSGTAHATSLVFSSSAIRAPGEFCVDMWLEDATRNRDVNTLQFDVDLPAGSLAALDPFLLPNTRHSDPDGNPLVDGGGDLGPFDLFESIGDPAGSIDVREVLQSSDWFDFQSLAADWSAFPVCTGTACVPQQLGMARNRLYLGSFHIFLPNGELGEGPPVFVRVPPNSIFGFEFYTNAIDPLQVELRVQLVAAGGSLQIEGLAPEPASIALLALVLAAASFVRGRFA